ncbi:hypothetical protein G6F65_016824 [Rhizopus arrhizus]|nr:hypothetical protein G6F65_016824 [Rhizopus arrhizus]
MINERASAAIGRPFAINGDLSVKWERAPDEGGWRAWVPWPHVIANDISVGNAPWAKAPYFATLKRGEFSLAPLPLLRQRVVIRRIQLTEPAADLERAADVVIRLIGASMNELRAIERERAGLPAVAVEGPEGERAAVWSRLAVAALSDLTVYPAPVFLSLADFNHVQASVFQPVAGPGGVLDVLYSRPPRLDLGQAARGRKQRHGGHDVPEAYTRLQSRVRTLQAGAAAPEEVLRFIYVDYDHYASLVAEGAERVAGHALAGQPVGNRRQPRPARQARLDRHRLFPAAVGGRRLRADPPRQRDGLLREDHPVRHRARAGVAGLAVASAAPPDDRLCDRGRAGPDALRQ